MALTLDQIEEKVKPQLARFRALKAAIKFDLEGAGILILDASGPTPVISRQDRETPCTLKMTPENLLKLLDGSLDPMLAFTLGKLKIKGSMGLAIKLNSMLGDG